MTDIDFQATNSMKWDPDAETEYVQHLEIDDVNVFDRYEVSLS